MIPWAMNLNYSGGQRSVPCANRGEMFRFLLSCAGQVEDAGAHGKDLPAAEEGRTGPSRALGPGPLRPLLLVTEASQAPAEATCSSVNKPMTDPCKDRSIPPETLKDTPKVKKGS